MLNMTVSGVPMFRAGSTNPYEMVVAGEPPIKTKALLSNDSKEGTFVQFYHLSKFDPYTPEENRVYHKIARRLEVLRDLDWARSDRRYHCPESVELSWNGGIWVPFRDQAEVILYLIERYGLDVELISSTTDPSSG